MYSEENFLVVKSILELGKPDWDLLRNRKGDWPEDKLLWKQYRSFSMKELKELFIKYGQYKVELGKYNLLIFQPKYISFDFW